MVFGCVARIVQSERKYYCHNNQKVAAIRKEKPKSSIGHIGQKDWSQNKRHQRASSEIDNSWTSIQCCWDLRIAPVCNSKVYCVIKGVVVADARNGRDGISRMSTAENHPWHWGQNRCPTTNKMTWRKVTWWRMQGNGGDGIYGMSTAWNPSNAERMRISYTSF